MAQYVPEAYEELVNEIQDMINKAVPDRVMFRYRNKSPLWLAKKFGWRVTKGQLPYVIAKYLVGIGFLKPEQGLAFVSRSVYAIGQDIQNLKTNFAALADLKIKLGGVSVSGSTSEAGVQTEQGPATEPEVIRVHVSGAGKRQKVSVEEDLGIKEVYSGSATVEDFDDLPDLVTPPDDYIGSMGDVD